MRLGSGRGYTAFNPLEIPAFRSRMLGPGFMGGKAKGLFLAEYVLARHGLLGRRVLIPPTWVLPTGVFEQFLDENGLYRFSPGARTMEEYGEIVAEFVRAPLPGAVRERLAEWLAGVDFPLAVRSSAFLEDSLRYSFAGKYHTVFIPNRGSLEVRLAQLEGAIKEVYASVYGPDAVAYRQRRGLGDDSMAVMLQQLVGAEHRDLFYPEISGVGFSRNYRCWSERVRPQDGVLRLVFGLGTRCTGRGYARLASLTNPDLRPEGNDPRDVARYSQEIFDALHLPSGRLQSWNINQRPDVVACHPRFGWYARLYLPDRNELVPPPALLPEGPPGTRYVFSFPDLARHFRPVLETVRDLFALLEEPDAMDTPVDIEFTYDTGTGEFYLVQARPLSSYEEFRPVRIPPDLPGRVILQGDRMMTNGQLEAVSYLVYVDPDLYRESADKARVAREVGRANERLAGDRYILVGPGRWGTTHPAQGVPVQYREVAHAGLLVELGSREDPFIPELSYGTHFFADLENDRILYLPVFTHLPSNVYDRDWFARTPAESTGHPAVKVYRGRFSAYLDGRQPLGLVVAHPV